MDRPSNSQHAICQSDRRPVSETFGSRPPICLRKKIGRNVAAMAS